MSGHRRIGKCQCCAVVGAGDLVSHIWRFETGRDLPEYRFSIGLANSIPEGGLQLFQPPALESLSNLLRVIARELLHDGGLDINDKAWMNHYANSMDALCERIKSSKLS